MNLYSIYSVISDSRDIGGLLNSLYVGFISSFILIVLGLFIAMLMLWCGLSGNLRIYILSVLPILIPDRLWGIAGRILFDPTIGLFSSMVPQTLIINYSSSIFLIVLILMLKWLPIISVAIDAIIVTMGIEKVAQIKMDFKSQYKACFTVYMPYLRDPLIMIGCLVFLIGFRQHEMITELTSSGGGLVVESWSIWNYKELFEFAQLTRATIEALFVLIVLLIPITIIKNIGKRVV
jgi:multiple sugar transport system permease protein